MDEQTLKRRLQGEWVRLENRVVELDAMMAELDEKFKDYEDESIRSTAAYMVMKKEHDILVEHQTLYERLIHK